MNRVVEGLRLFGGLMLPMFASAREARRFRPAVRWLLHAALLTLGLGLLYALHVALDLDRVLRLPDPAFHNLWLPLLGLLVYVLCWVGRWLWDVLGPEQETSVFPDIDQAWQDAVRALDQGGVDLTALPLFLLLGRPQQGEEPLLQGMQPKLVVNQAPRRTDAPLHVYANREGIYVACPGASLLGRQAALMAMDHAETPPDDGDDAPAELYGTLSMAPQGAAAAIEQIMARARAQGRGADMLVDEERRAIGLLTAAEPQHGTGDETRPRPVALLQNRAEVDVCAQRLQYLCRLIARDRRPFCPINGILLLLPIAATASDDAATQVGLIAQRDLTTVRKTLRVRCPLFALFCDLETLPGFRSLVERLAENLRDRRLGQRFPLVPDLEPPAVAGMLESGVQHIGNRLVPNLVSSLWQTEATGGGTFAEAVRGNAELYRFLGGLRDRQPRIARVLTRAVVSEGQPVAMLGGCYLAGTGVDPRTEQAFIPGVLRRLIENQDFVAWTPEAMDEERRALLLCRIGYTAIGLVVAASALLAAFVLLGRG